MRGDVVEIYPSFAYERAIRLEFFGDVIESINEIDPLSGSRIKKIEKIALFPNSHWLTPRDRLDEALKNIEKEMKASVEGFLQTGQDCRGTKDRGAHKVRYGDAEGIQLLPRDRELFEASQRQGPLASRPIH